MGTRVDLKGRMVVGMSAALLLLAGKAGALTGSLFESTDGNLVVNGAGAKDWANAPNFSGGSDSATGQNDDSFGQGTKEDTEPPIPVTGGMPNNRSDLVRFYTGMSSSQATWCCTSGGFARTRSARRTGSSP